MPCERDPLKTGLWLGKSKFFILPCTVCCGQAKGLAAADFSLKALFFIGNYWYAMTSVSSSVKLASKITFCLGFLLGHLSRLTMEIFLTNLRRSDVGVSFVYLLLLLVN